MHVSAVEPEMVTVWKLQHAEVRVECQRSFYHLPFDQFVAHVSH